MSDECISTTRINGLVMSLSSIYLALVPMLALYRNLSRSSTVVPTVTAARGGAEAASRYLLIIQTRRPVCGSCTLSPSMAPSRQQRRKEAFLTKSICSCIECVCVIQLLADICLIVNRSSGWSRRCQTSSRARARAQQPCGGRTAETSSSRRFTK